MDVLREHVPDVELSSDWIVGFPGETDEDHLASEAVLEEQRFVVNYIFKYDPRPTTHAADELADDVPEAVKKERNQRLLQLSERVALRRLQEHVGHTRRVFVEDVAGRRGRLAHRPQHARACRSRCRATPTSSAARSRVAIENATAFGLSGRLAGPSE